jgi:UDP:flavonoid glycosyltransferase YjiC (YdhE family)
MRANYKESSIMKLLAIAIGTRGDIEPSLTIAEMLRQIK